MKGSFDRRKCRAVYVGGVGIGADNPISIQSMTNTDTHDIEATYTQVMRLWEAGCDIVRITAPDLQSVKTFEALISRGVKIPLVADIHFNHEIAIAAAESGVSKISTTKLSRPSRPLMKSIAPPCISYSARKRRSIK